MGVLKFYLQIEAMPPYLSLIISQRKVGFQHYWNGQPRGERLSETSEMEDGEEK